MDNLMERRREIAEASENHALLIDSDKDYIVTDDGLYILIS